MKVQYILPAILIVLMASSAVVYLAQGDWRRGGYWACAAVLNFFVTV